MNMTSIDGQLVPSHLHSFSLYLRVMNIDLMFFTDCVTGNREQTMISRDFKVLQDNRQMLSFTESDDRLANDRTKLVKSIQSIFR